MHRHSIRILLLCVIPLQASCDIPFPGVSGPPGNDFASAGLLVLSAAGSASISGTLTQGEVDVYDLGPCDAGDRIQVTIRAAAGSLLDPTAGLFNADGHLLTLNDDLDLSAGRLESVIDFIVAVATAHCYLATTRSFFTVDLGGYEGTVNVAKGGAVPQAQVQTLVLDFRGGLVSIPGIPNRTLDPFDAADINAAYAGMTDFIKDGIISTVRQNFQGTGLVVVTSDDNPPPAPGSFSTLYFGGFSANAFGISEDIDHENMNRCDDGIVFTNNFSDPFAPQPSASGVATAIGNVAAHEGGHLLGLEHVADITALMDTTGTASTLLADQTFKIAPLDTTVFPIGEQNSPLLLERVIPQ